MFSVLYGTYRITDRSAYAQHNLDVRNLYGTIENTMEVVRAIKIGKYVCTYKQNIRLNAFHIESHDPIFNAVYSHDQEQTQYPAPLQRLYVYKPE
jgi:hypothetical protein